MTDITTMHNSGSFGGGDGRTKGAEESEHDLVPAGLVKAKTPLPVINPRYTKVGESFRKNVPHEMQCSMFCGGKRCKYESGDNWQEDQMAIKGIFSHWVTEEVLAMARPNTELIEKARLVEQFKQHGITSVVNLQIPGEHASCGPRLDKSGFSYDPNDLMRSGIFFYNFAWKDYADAPMTNLLDMVKVLSFATSEGKVAVHCHAGLGRTGVLIACYLIYHLRVRSNDALRYVRLKRPGAVQTRRQIACVKEFETFHLPQCCVFSNRPVGHPDKRGGRFTLEQYLKRQKSVAHGFEARALKCIPKIVFLICERLLKLCDAAGPQYRLDEGNFTKAFVAFGLDDRACKLPEYQFIDDNSSGGSSSGVSRPGSETSSSFTQSCSSTLSSVDDSKLDEILADGIRNQSLDENAVAQELNLVKRARDDQDGEEEEAKLSPRDIYEALLDTHCEKLRSEETAELTDDALLWKHYRTELNVKLSAWNSIAKETNVFVLTGLLFEWMEHLKGPAMDKDSITYVVIHCDKIESALRRLSDPVCYLLEYLVRFVARLQPLPRECSENIMRRLVASLTHQSILINDIVYPSGRGFLKLRGGTAESTIKFMMKLFDRVLQDQGRRRHRNESGLQDSSFPSLSASFYTRESPESSPKTPSSVVDAEGGAKFVIGEASADEDDEASADEETDSGQEP